jgi:hypothetical protein
MQNLSELMRRLVTSQVEFVLDALIRAKEAMNRNHDKITVMLLKKIKEQQT